LPFKADYRCFVLGVQARGAMNGRFNMIGERRPRVVHAVCEDPTIVLYGIERLLLVNQIGFAEQERTQVVTQQTQTQQLLSVARNVERSQLVTHGAAVKVTARSRRNAARPGGSPLTYGVNGACPPTTSTTTVTCITRSAHTPTSRPTRRPPA